MESYSGYRKYCRVNVMGGKAVAKNDELAKLTKRFQTEAKALRDKAKKMDEEAKMLATKADRMEAVVRELEAE